MCGIAGHFGTPASADVRARMLAALVFRGPDARHVATFDERGRPTPAAEPAAAGLVHARLSIIDPRPVADQPMGNDDGSVWICYNGEVYGWRDEARALEARGYRFRTHCDTEFVLRAYEAYGIDAMLPKLRGMFAFAIVDFRTRRVHLVRDRLGLKPMVYAHVPGGFAFASTVRGVLPWLPDDRRGFSAEALDAFLAHRYIPAPRTIFTHVGRLPNAHRLEYDLDTDRVHVHRYWTPAAAPGVNCAALLDEAIELRTVADRPLGLFLSSGVDSSTIASRLAALGHREYPTYSAAFPGSPLDESADAKQTADALGLVNHAIEIPETIAADFDRIVAALDEPFADPAAFPTWYLARGTVRDVTVVLSGDGGDELFGGYKRVAQHLRQSRRGRFTLPAPILPHALPQGWRKILAELAFPWQDAYALRFSGFTPNQRAFLEPGLKAPRVHYWRTPDFGGDTASERILGFDFANYLPEYALRKADLMTMAHGLELRAPLLDHRFVEAVLGLPAAVRFTSPPKRFLAEITPDLELLGVFKRKKRGFNPPLDPWLTSELADRLPALGKNLEQMTGGQLERSRIDAFVSRYATHRSLAEQVLALAVLDESLRQLRAGGAYAG